MATDSELPKNGMKWKKVVVFPKPLKKLIWRFKMAKKNKKPHAGANTRKQARQEGRRRFKSLQDLAGTIIEKEGVPEESKFTGRLEDLTPEDLREEADRMIEGLPDNTKFDPNSLINGILKDAKE
jgi:hypothetical protein